MDHFLFTQLCRGCKKSFKTFKICLSYCDDNGRFNLSKKEVEDAFSFVCLFCNSMNTVDFEEICNPYTIWYLRKENEINRRIEEVLDNLLKIKMEKLKIPTNSL